MAHHWRRQARSVERDVENYLLSIEKPTYDVTSTSDYQRLHPGQCDHEVLALSRKKMDLETAPTGRKLEQVKQLMLRCHRASGHAGMSNLVQLLQARGAPGWALELAGKLKCPECEEAAKPRPQPPASTGEDPIGIDVFEYEDEEKQVKHKLIIWRDRGYHLMEYTGAWEPRTENIIQSLGNS